ncbi:MAG: Gfo/Idh/MocA family oxidoreductase [Candidatus Omnitrophica bacterium]|nr:Gfo/Idh/MocA family oxidoreductase [Candidatus Omnitrophota bacterium]
MRINRRKFMSTTAASGAIALLGTTLAANAVENSKTKSPNEQFGIGAIGLRYQGSVITNRALPYGRLVALCDVDRHMREMGNACFGSQARLYEDYQGLLDRKDVDVVLIGTPDHWHTKMVVDACRAGKDIYVEKPLTLTIDEGKTLCEVVKETQRVVQVGTWQRSDVRFRQVCEIVRSGRLGELKKAVVTIDGNPNGGPFENVPTPKHLNWDLWLGQAPLVPYCEERCHYTFRWWKEYSGGKMTDWGAHHVDIAQWGIGEDGPVEIDGQGPFPETENGYNMPTKFHATLKYQNGVEFEIRSEGKIGVRFQCEKGDLFVTRGSIETDPPELLKEVELDRAEFRLYSDNLNFEPKVGKLLSIENHMRNFFDCVRSRKTPISDVVSQHRSVSTCHLANISMRLGRPLKWDPKGELFVDDQEANGFLAREQRKGFEIA